MLLYKIQLCLFFVCVCGRGEKLDLKIDYYEALIKKGVQDAAKYKLRTDNSDFFANVTDSKIYDFGTFDFIIIGAGSSGSALANRLSENRHWSILVLEAGDEEDDLSEIPGLHVLLPSSDKNWGYTTTKQKNGCFGMIGGRCPYARGQSIGGSGAINGIMYNRGHKSDYDKWENLGNPGWSYQNISYYFRKSENSQIPDGEKGYHGFAGPLNNAYTFPENPLVYTFIEAHEILGLPYIDINGHSSEGVGRNQNSALFGRRVSGGSSYLKYSRNRMNLNITIKAFVTKINFKDGTKRAESVTFVKDGVTYRASTRLEIILSAGAINSPQLLMLSGVGPCDELKRHGIKVIQNLPVGQFMRDHIAFNHNYFRTNVTGEDISLRQQIKDYLNGIGTLTTSFAPKALSFKNFNNSPVEFIIVAPMRKTGSFGAPRNFNKEAQKLIATFNSSTDFTISTILLHPESTGKITLKSKNPRDFPEIDVGIFSSQRDLEVLYEAVRYVQKLVRTSPFQKFNSTQFLNYESCKHLEYDTKEFWFCAIQHLSFNGYHMSSTAKMGPKDDPMAVVDSQLRVYGIPNLRVVDCSIMPDTISGHTNSIAFAIGEKAADIIKKHYRYKMYYGDFDFVIVGAGTTGCVLVNRLSEIENWNILVLEAGEEEDDLSQIPGIHTLSSNFFKNWGYISTSQKNGCLGMINNQCMVTRGLSVGGSSAISGLIYSRGTKYDFDQWASQGNSGWSFEEVLPYFKKAENFRNILADDDKGFGGPINVEYSNPPSSLLPSFLDGMKQLGYNKIDYNSATNNIGTNRIQYNTNRGERVSSGNTYLKQARNRHNVKVLTGALVTKIIMDDANVARGVTFIMNGEIYKVMVKKEVILSAGAVNSPHLLMLSGIGQKSMLEKHGIKSVKNLPVGKVLKDHLGYLSLYVRTNYTQNTPPLRDLLKQYLQGQEYLTKSLNSESIGYISTNNRTKNPNIEYLFVPPTGTQIGLYASRRFNKEMTESVSRKVNISTDISIAVTLLHPKSTGRLFLKSNNPKDFPEIDIGIFNEESDVEEIYQGIKIVLKLLHTEPFKKLNASIYSVPKPCEGYEFNSKSFWYCSIKHISFAAHQMTSTTKMGTRFDPEAVVDRHLKVHGIKRLRIADCGVIPSTLSGQLNAVAFMIGEKASDMIKEEYLDACCIKIP